MDKQNNNDIQKKLNVITELLRQLVAVELYKNGVTKQSISKRLHIAKAKVVTMLEGIKKEKASHV